MNERERLEHFPNSELHDYMKEVYEEELSFHAEPIGWIRPEELPTIEELINNLGDGYGYCFDPLENMDGDDIARAWADMGYPLPADVNDILAYGGDVNDIALTALREYVGLYDVVAHAEKVLEAEAKRRNNE